MPSAHYAPVLEAPAAGDLFGDGRQEVVADDLQGNVYAWDASGQLVFHRDSDPRYSGAPLPGDPSWAAQRAGVRDRTEAGFLTSPVLAKLDPAAPGGYDIIAAGEDRHLYAWHADGSAVKGFPVLVEDPDKLASVDATSNQPTFNGNANADPGQRRRPGQARRHARGRRPRRARQAADDHRRQQRGVPHRHRRRGRAQRVEREHGLAGRRSGTTGVLQFANSRVYAIKASGCSSDAPRARPAAGLRGRRTAPRARSATAGRRRSA